MVDGMVRPRLWISRILFKPLLHLKTLLKPLLNCNRIETPFEC